MTTRTCSECGDTWDIEDCVMCYFCGAICCYYCIIWCDDPEDEDCIYFACPGCVEKAKGKPCEPSNL